MIGLDGLPLLRLKFDLMALDDAAAPPYKGDLIRRGLLWWLSEYWCIADSRCRAGCRHTGACLFGRLVEPAQSTDWSPAVRKLIGGDTPPPAFALWDAGERRKTLGVGSLWGFELTLIGDLAASKAEQVIAIVQEAAEHGMGHQDGSTEGGYLLRSKVLRVSAMANGGEGERRTMLAQTERRGETWTLMPAAHEREAGRTTWDHALGWAAAQGSPIRSLTLRFLAPMVLKEGGRQVHEPDLGALARSVMRRLRILSEVHGAGEWPREAWGPALDAAEAGVLEHAEITTGRYDKWSQRNGETEVLGFTGQAWYGGPDFGPLLGPLWYGQWLHAGKGYAYGNGRYQIVSATP